MPERDANEVSTKTSPSEMVGKLFRSSQINKMARRRNIGLAVYEDSLNTRQIEIN